MSHYTSGDGLPGIHVHHRKHTRSVNVVPENNHYLCRSLYRTRKYFVWSPAPSGNSDAGRYVTVTEPPDSTGSEVLTALTVTRSSVFWDMTPSSLVTVNRRFWGTYRLHLQGWSKKQAANRPLLLASLFGLLLNLEHGSDTFLRNVGVLPNYTALQPRR
jgi:hypothetical protein